jgi:hypothetical protein
MLRSRMRQPHYYGLVKLLGLETTQRTPEEIAVDAYELFGEGRNWWVPVLFFARRALELCRRSWRLSRVTGNTISLASLAPHSPGSFIW